MEKLNFLFGRGERLTEDVEIRQGGGKKKLPYTFEESKKKLTPQIEQAVTEIYNLPDAACPYDFSEVSFTMHPEFIAKSYFPLDLLLDVDIKVVGSRPKSIVPRNFSSSKNKEITESTELITRGTRESYRNWLKKFPSWKPSHNVKKNLISIEEISVSSPKSKVIGNITKNESTKLEIVLHSSPIDEHQLGVFNKFLEYLEEMDILHEVGQQFDTQGLFFIELIASPADSINIATFSMLRVLREMPLLRKLDPPFRGIQDENIALNLPTGPPVSENTRMAVFDGGIPDSHYLKKWVNSYDFSDSTNPIQKCLDHGVAVTSAALFGNLDTNVPIPQPFSKIDHYRVVNAEDFSDRNLYKVLDRIDSVLSEEEYNIVSLSLGPHMPIEDKDVHAWTSVLDTRLAESSTLALIAVGNDGDKNFPQSRIQVPSDCINAMSIGACDSKDRVWKRAMYSSVGPGRSPGLVKPDIVSFGGTVDNPFILLSSSSTPKTVYSCGTSFATPEVARVANGLFCFFGNRINHLGIRALLVQTAETNDQGQEEVGWGRCAQDLDSIVTCEDNEFRVVYQGEITPSKYVRAKIPVPSVEIPGKLELMATICFKSKVDTHHPGNYTRAGLEVTFRPHSGRYSNPSQTHPDSKSFFGPPHFIGSENKLRKDAKKWENCFQAKKKFLGKSIKNPVFDIHYNSRRDSMNFRENEKLKYALIVSVRSTHFSNFYEMAVSEYSSILEELKPMFEIPIQI